MFDLLKNHKKSTSLNLYQQDESLKKTIRILKETSKRHPKSSSFCGHGPDLQGPTSLTTLRSSQRRHGQFRLLSRHGGQEASSATIPWIP